MFREFRLSIDWQILGDGTAGTARDASQASTAVISWLCLVYVLSRRMPALKSEKIDNFRLRSRYSLQSNRVENSSLLYRIRFSRLSCQHFLDHPYLNLLRIKKYMMR